MRDRRELRTRLLWFAFGAATLLLVTIASSKLSNETPPHPTEIAYLELSEPVVEDPEIEDIDMIANRTGKLARDCGADLFQTTFLYTDHSPTLELPITPENAGAVHCALREAEDQAIQWKLIFAPAPRILSDN